MTSSVDLVRSLVLGFLQTEDKAIAETYRKKHNVVSRRVWFQSQKHVFHTRAAFFTEIAALYGKLTLAYYSLTIKAGNPGFTICY